MVWGHWKEAEGCHVKENSFTEEHITELPEFLPAQSVWQIMETKTAPDSSIKSYRCIAEAPHSSAASDWLKESFDKFKNVFFMCRPPRVGGLQVKVQGLCFSDQSELVAQSKVFGQ